MGKPAGFAQVLVTGPGLGTNNFTHKKPVPERHTHPYWLYLCIIELTYWNILTLYTLLVINGLQN
jgi:hypothetical protein